MTNILMQNGIVKLAMLENNSVNIDNIRLIRNDDENFIIEINSIQDELFGELNLMEGGGDSTSIILLISNGTDDCENSVIYFIVDNVSDNGEWLVQTTMNSSSSFYVFGVWLETNNS